MLTVQFEVYNHYCVLGLQDSHVLAAQACMCAKSLQPWLPLFDPMDQAPLSMGLSRQECWTGMPCPPPGDLPHPGIKPESPVAPAVQVDSLPLSHQGSPLEPPYKWPQMEEAVHLISQ